MKFSGLYSSLILTIQKLVLLMTHLTGTSTYVRVGGSYVDNNTQPGLFSADHEEEYSAASHGEGTEYCGRIFYRSSNSPATILMSRGIGTYIVVNDGNVSSECIGDANTVGTHAYCHRTSTYSQCPKGWGNIYTYDLYKPGCFWGTYYPNPTQAGTFSLNTGSLAHYHQSGNNTVLRVGNAPSGSGEAGVFHSTTVAEQSPASHGAGTAYCGRVYYCDYAGDDYYRISTGIGTYETVYGHSGIHSACLATSDMNRESAHCSASRSSRSCPYNWGTYFSYSQYLPGCCAGTYYPNPTPASDTDVNTGSRIVFIVSTEMCTLLAMTTITKIIGTIKLGYFAYRPITSTPAFG